MKVITVVKSTARYGTEHKS